MSEEEIIKQIKISVRELNKLIRLGYDKDLTIKLEPVNIHNDFRNRIYLSGLDVKIFKEL